MKKRTLSTPAPKIKQLDLAVLAAVNGGGLSGPEEDYNYRMGIITDSSVFKQDEMSSVEC